MQHFKVDYQDNSTLGTNYPHTPTDFDASLQDYLEDMLSQGYTFSGVLPNVSMAGHFIFTVTAK